MAKLTPLAKGLIVVTILSVFGAAAYHLVGKDMLAGNGASDGDGNDGITGTDGDGALGSKGNPLKVSIVSFHGYAPALVANGASLTTQPGSIFEQNGVHVEFIIQRNGLTRRLWEQLDDASPPNLSFLFDESMGTGVATAAWPPPPAGMELFGYAGGLNPGNVRAQIVAMGRAAAGRTLWCDMESGAPPPPPPPVARPHLSFPSARAGVRTARPSGEDIFDLDKCMACVRHAIALKVVPATASVFGGRATKRRRA